MVTQHAIANPAVKERLYTEPKCPDSTIERTTVDGGLPQGYCRVLPNCRASGSPLSGEYNPDFGYVVQRDGKAQDLYLVVGNQGVRPAKQDCDEKAEDLKRPKRFFKALKEIIRFR